MVIGEVVAEGQQNLIQSLLLSKFGEPEPTSVSRANLIHELRRPTEGHQSSKRPPSAQALSTEKRCKSVTRLCTLRLLPLPNPQTELPPSVKGARSYLAEVNVNPQLHLRTDHGAA